MLISMQKEATIWVVWTTVNGKNWDGQLRFFGFSLGKIVFLRYKDRSGGMGIRDTG